MRIAIVDDEPSLIKLARHTISDFGKEKNIKTDITEFLSGEALLNNYRPGTFDIIFMDVFMPGISGIDTVLKLREVDATVAVIFLTTSESHMKNALSCHAFDYLIKPATRTDFFKVLSECVNMLGDKILADSKYIEFKSKGINIELPVAKIIYVVANGHLITIRTDAAEYDAKETFSNIADSLSDCDNMLVINRGVLVNMDCIDRFDEGNCYLNDGTCFAVKIRAIKSIREAYELYRLKK